MGGLSRRVVAHIRGHIAHTATHLLLVLRIFWGACPPAPCRRRVAAGSTPRHRHDEDEATEGIRRNVKFCVVISVAHVVLTLVLLLRGCHYYYFRRRRACDGHLYALPGGSSRQQRSSSCCWRYISVAAHAPSTTPAIGSSIHRRWLHRLVSNYYYGRFTGREVRSPGHQATVPREESDEQVRHTRSQLCALKYVVSYSIRVDSIRLKET